MRAAVRRSIADSPADKQHRCKGSRLTISEKDFWFSESRHAVQTHWADADGRWHVKTRGVKQGDEAGLQDRVNESVDWLVKWKSNNHHQPLESESAASAAPAAGPVEDEEQGDE